MTMLGIDYGTKHIGLAYSDETDTVAFPLSVLPNDKGLLPAVERAIAEVRATTIVVGESKDHRGKDNPVMADIMRFVDALKKRLDIPVYLEPEFMSSLQAQRFQGDSPHLDASAAAIILQSYLDRKKK